MQNLLPSLYFHTSLLPGNANNEPSYVSSITLHASCSLSSLAFTNLPKILKKLWISTNFFPLLLSRDLQIFFIFWLAAVFAIFSDLKQKKKKTKTKNKIQKFMNFLTCKCQRKLASLLNTLGAIASQLVFIF